MDLRRLSSLTTNDAFSPSKAPPRATATDADDSDSPLHPRQVNFMIDRIDDDGSLLPVAAHSLSLRPFSAPPKIQIDQG